MTFKTGSRVIITTSDGRTIPGTITIASENQVSLMLSFEAMISGHVGMMPVLRHEDGSYFSIIDGTRVTLVELQ